MPQIPTLSASSHVAPPAKLASATNSAPVEGGDSDAFATLFAQLAAQQADEDPGVITPATAFGDDDSTRQAVTALLETLRKDQPVAEPPDARENSLPLPLSEAAAAIIAAPVTPPVLPANSAADGDAAANPSSAGRPLPSVVTPPETPVGEFPAVISSAPEATPALPASAGREFAAALTDAIKQTHETSSPGLAETSLPSATASAVQQVITQQSPAHADKAHESLTIVRPAGTPGWSEEVGNRIAWMAGQGRSQAELVLNPPHLGRIEVNLTLNGDQAAASFASANPVVRELLEAAIPRLREALADAGIQLGQTQVGAEHARQQPQQEKHGENTASDPARFSETIPANSSISQRSVTTLTTLKSGRSLVDVFA